MTKGKGVRSPGADRADSMNLQTPAGKAAAANHARQVSGNKKK